MRCGRAGRCRCRRCPRRATLRHAPLPAPCYLLLLLESSSASSFPFLLSPRLLSLHCLFKPYTLFSFLRPWLSNPRSLPFVFFSSPVAPFSFLSRRPPGPVTRFARPLHSLGHAPLTHLALVRHTPCPSTNPRHLHWILWTCSAFRHRWTCLPQHRDRAAPPYSQRLWLLQP